VKEAGQTNIYGFITKPYTKIDIEINLEIFTQRLQKEKKIFIKEETNNIKLGQGCSYDIEAKLLYQNKNVVQCSKNESKLLYLFCSHYNKVVSLKEIRFFIWKDKEIGESTIRDTISRLRKKVPALNIVNMVGNGYILKV
jgi:DNA-binding response OmpR family regulator